MGGGLQLAVAISVTTSDTSAQIDCFFVVGVIAEDEFQLIVCILVLCELEVHRSATHTFLNREAIQFVLVLCILRENRRRANVCGLVHFFLDNCNERSTLSVTAQLNSLSHFESCLIIALFQAHLCLTIFSFTNTDFAFATQRQVFFTLTEVLLSILIHLDGISILFECLTRSRRRGHQLTRLHQACIGVVIKTAVLQFHQERQVIVLAFFFGQLFNLRYFFRRNFSNQSFARGHFRNVFSRSFRCCRDIFNDGFSNCGCFSRRFCHSFFGGSFCGFFFGDSRRVLFSHFCNFFCRCFGGFFVSNRFSSHFLCRRFFISEIAQKGFKAIVLSRFICCDSFFGGFFCGSFGYFFLGHFFSRFLGFSNSFHFRFGRLSIFCDCFCFSSRFFSGFLCDLFFDGFFCGSFGYFFLGHFFSGFLGFSNGFNFRFSRLSVFCHFFCFLSRFFGRFLCDLFFRGFFYGSFGYFFLGHFFSGFLGFSNGFNFRFGRLGVFSHFFCFLSRFFSRLFSDFLNRLFNLWSGFI